MDENKSIDLTDEMVGAAVDAYRQMAIHDERSWFDPRDIVVGIIRAAFLSQPSGPQVRFQGQLKNSLPPQVE